jgi:hypothetical protein
VQDAVELTPLLALSGLDAAWLIEVRATVAMRTSASRALARFRRLRTVPTGTAVTRAIAA